MEAKMGRRDPLRVDEKFGSAWILTLGGEQTPVDRLEVTVDDKDFVRNYRVEAGGPADSGQKFRRVGAGVWRRRAGEEIKPMVANFGETRAARLRLTVIDHRNQPLKIRKIEYSAPARQIVFAATEASQKLRLYFGNPEAERTEYDFARNLPDRLDPPPRRAALGPRVDNPVYVPIPKPLTERLPWLIYVVLSAVILVLVSILVSLSRAAIRAYDLATSPGEAG